jgi:outer membrane protein TolC
MRRIVGADRLDDLPEIRPPDIHSVLSERPEMRGLQTGLKQAQANLDLQRANAVPDPQPMAGYKRFSGSARWRQHCKRPISDPKCRLNWNSTQTS